MRTTVEIPLNGKSVDAVLQIIERKMSANNFQKKLLAGEEVWLKGDGVITLLQCFAVCFKENSILLQGWVKDAMTGEAELKGFVGSIPKKKMRNIIDEICMEVNR